MLNILQTLSLYGSKTQKTPYKIRILRETNDATGRRFWDILTPAGYTVNPIIYDNGKIAYDHPERLAGYVIKYLQRNAEKLTRLISL